MGRMVNALVGAGLTVFALGATPAVGSAATAPTQPIGLRGHVVAVTPSAATIVVDVPEGSEVLRLGATVTDQTRIRVNGKAASLDDLKPGRRVWIAYDRTSAGDEATSVIAG